MFDFAETTKDMTAEEILNYYRNLYYAEPQVTERGIVANAINDYLQKAAPMAEWISVEERIPKNFESVLVLATRLEDDEYDVLVAYHDRGDWEEQHTRRYESPICGEIKYWMPLPEPLKGE